MSTETLWLLGIYIELLLLTSKVTRRHWVPQHSCGQAREVVSSKIEKCRKNKETKLDAHQPPTTCKVRN